MSDPAIRELDDFISKAKIDKSNPRWKTKLPKPPQAKFTPGAKYFAAMDTSKGPIRIQLRPDVAPMHVSSFVYLSRLGFYDGLGFHRVINGFMAQGGCPLGTGTGGPGYQFDGEYDLKKAKHDRPHLLSMANAGPGTDGSQFFITFAPTPHLDGRHSIFGEVMSGQETVKALERSGSRSGTPAEKLTLDKVTIAVE